MYARKRSLSKLVSEIEAKRCKENRNSKGMKSFEAMLSRKPKNFIDRGIS